MTTFDHTISYSELKDSYIRVVNGEKICNRAFNNDHLLNHLRPGWKNRSGFYGPTSDQVIEWLRKGYHQPGLKLDPPVTPVRKRRRIKFAEEGELQLDLAWSGHDYPFLAWDKREVMPGMLINILVNFVAGTKVDVIIAYNRWILRALVALESAGMDLEVWVSSDSYDIFNRNSNHILANHIQVKKEGEQTDLLSWSPILSPAGFRHLTFLEYVIGGDYHGFDVDHGLGRGLNSRTGQKWAVEYDMEKRRLNFLCPWAPKNFPEENMDLELREVLQLARRAA